MDLKLGVSTFGFVRATHSDAQPYLPTPYSVLTTCFKLLALSDQDHFLDIGCGYGRPALLASATCNVASCHGIDLDENLIDQARTNAQRLRGSAAPPQFSCVSATDFDYDPFDVLFMYNPFHRDTMRLVINQVERSMERRPRSIRIAYLNPICADVLDSQPWLKKTDSLTSGELPKLPVGRQATLETPAADFYGT